MRLLILASLISVCLGDVSEHMNADVDLGKAAEAELKPKAGRNAEDQIPVIEIKGEGKPMTSAQIRALEEEASGPADIKVKKTWRPRECPKAAARKDFVTLQYKGFLESGKKFDQTYGRDPIRIQLGVGMIMPGLDKGLKGMCDTELRKIQVPWRLSRRRSSTTYKHIPKEEHWLTFDIEMLTVEAWTPELQFQFLDLNNDTTLTTAEMRKYIEHIRKEFGKHWHNEDIDNKFAAEYYINYFDIDGDGKVTVDEFSTVTERDQKLMDSVEKKPTGRRRDPGIAWILDFNNDGIVTQQEMDEAPERLMKKPQTETKDPKNEKTEL